MVRVGVASTLGVTAAVLTGMLRGDWHFSPAVGWIISAAVYLASIGVFSVVASWFAIHTTFMLRYAQLYFHGGHSGTVSFHENEYRPQLP